MKDIDAALAALTLLFGVMLASVVAAQTGMAPGDATQTPSSAAPAKPAAGETSPGMTVSLAEDLLDRQVMGTDGETLGRVGDVLLAPDGQPLWLIVSTEERAGARSKEVAIDMAHVEIRSDSADLYVADVTGQDIARMPPYAGDEGSMTSLNRNKERR